MNLTGFFRMSGSRKLKQFRWDKDGIKYKWNGIEINLNEYDEATELIDKLIDGAEYDWQVKELKDIRKHI